jgi:hypothetical protein
LVTATGDNGQVQFGRSPAGRIVTIDAKPAGPSTRAKVTGSECPQGDGEMVPGIELGEAVYSCPACAATNGAA